MGNLGKYDLPEEEPVNSNTEEHEGKTLVDPPEETTTRPAWKIMHDKALAFLSEVEHVDPKAITKDVLIKVHGDKGRGGLLRDMINVIPLSGPSDHPVEDIRGKELFPGEHYTREWKSNIFRFYGATNAYRRLWRLVYVAAGFSDAEIDAPSGSGCMNDATIAAIEKISGNKNKGIEPSVKGFVAQMNAMEKITEIPDGKGGTWKFHNGITLRDINNRNLAIDTRIIQKRKTKKAEQLKETRNKALEGVSVFKAVRERMNREQTERRGLFGIPGKIRDKVVKWATDDLTDK